MVERFTGLVVTKDTYKPSKEVRAEINKVIKIIDRQRIDKVNEVKKPIDDFNDRTKTLTAKLSTVSNDLGKQLNEYNDKRRAGKHEIQFAKFKQIVDEYGLQLDQVTYGIIYHLLFRLSLRKQKKPVKRCFKFKISLKKSAKQLLLGEMS